MPSGRYAGEILRFAAATRVTPIARVYRDFNVPVSLTGEVPSGLISGSLQAGLSPDPTVAR